MARIYVYIVVLGRRVRPRDLQTRLAEAGFGRIDISGTATGPPPPPEKGQVSCCYSALQPQPVQGTLFLPVALGGTAASASR